MYTTIDNNPLVIKGAIIKYYPKNEIYKIFVRAKYQEQSLKTLYKLGKSVYDKHTYYNFIYELSDRILVILER